MSPSTIHDVSPAELFPASLIPADAAGAFPAGYRLRPLRRDDHAAGFVDCLSVLTWVGDMTEPEFHARYDDMAKSNGTYFYLVVEHAGRAVGTGALVAEKKFIHNRGKCGHIEEISIAKEHQGKGLGLQLVQALNALAAAVGCYKTILNCGERTEQFYVKCGYHNSGIEMSQYFEEAVDAYHRG
ncbi:hypothetical protein PG993_008520 [Apiospora rasikravindrae]|uniref:Glucosamine 6-phosphate N-acetyltransferase n=1 Tax=Apiospora rasikravindrae TaxID=990691 RepID=A0ABR1T0L3_9PEZI